MAELAYPGTDRYSMAELMAILLARMAAGDAESAGGGGANQLIHAETVRELVHGAFERPQARTFDRRAHGRRHGDIRALDPLAEMHRRRGVKPFRCLGRVVGVVVADRGEIDRSSTPC